MLTTNPILKTVALLLLAAVTSCTNEPAHRSWPKPVSAATLSQFAGVYQNKSSDNKTGKGAVSATGQGFYYFLTGGRDDDMEYNGERLAIRFSPDGEVMKLRLYNPQGKLIQSNNLQRGEHFEFKNGVIVSEKGGQGLYGGVHGGPRFIAGASHNRRELHTTARGGILGHEEAIGGMLVGFIVPVGATENIWSYWPRLGDSKQ